MILKVRRVYFINLNIRKELNFFVVFLFFWLGFLLISCFLSFIVFLNLERYCFRLWREFFWIVFVVRFFLFRCRSLRFTLLLYLGGLMKEFNLFFSWVFFISVISFVWLVVFVLIELFSIIRFEIEGMVREFSLLLFCCFDFVWFFFFEKRNLEVLCIIYW